jgi:hypothetical protein
MLMTCALGAHLDAHSNAPDLGFGAQVLREKEREGINLKMKQFGPIWPFILYSQSLGHSFKGTATKAVARGLPNLVDLRL